MRFVLGGAVTLLYMLVQREPFRIARHEIWPLVTIGVFFSAQLVVMNIGQDMTSAGHGTALSSTMPIWTVTISQLFIPTDRLTRWKVLGMALSYAGILLVLFADTGIDSEGVTLLGDVLSLISAILLGLRVIMISNFAQRVPEGKLMMGQLVIGTALLAAGSYVFESPMYTMNEGFWFALSYQGFVIAGFGFLASAWLVKRYLPSTIAFFYFVQPVAGIALAWFILGEDPGSGLLGAIALLCAGAIVFSGQTYLSSRRQAAEKG